MNEIKKKKLKEIYSRPEKYPFERLNALMDYAILKLKKIQNGNTK